jgi:superfamily I DNA/RNA helicase
VALLRQGGSAADVIRTATGHLFVDEFQDVNGAQYQLVALLATTSTVFVIGDPDQAVYGFRGSDPRWFFSFIDEFAAETHHLERNYRSGAAILSAAGAVINRNPRSGPTVMQAESARPGAIHVQRCPTPEHEAVFIADQIEAQVGGTSHRSLERLDQGQMGQVSFRDIAVLYRTSRQAKTLAAVLGARSIPCQLVDLDAYYTRGDCRPLYLWLLLLAGLASDDEQLALLGRFSGVGRHSLRLLRQRLRAMTPATGRTFLGDRLGPADGRVGAVLDRFRALYSRLRALAAEQSIDAVLLALGGEYGLDPREPDLVRLRELSLTFDADLPACAAHLQTFSDSVVYDPRAEAVTLSTLHASKGLEFPVVFITGSEEGLLPFAPRLMLSPEAVRAHLEEERRLCYVGMTRAIATLCLTWCATRTVPGQPGEQRQPSRFLADIPATLVTRAQPITGVAHKRRSSQQQLSLFSPDD